jgi:hypothetical protein
MFTNLFGRKPVEVTPPPTSVEVVGGKVHISVGNCVKVYSIPEGWTISSTDNGRCLITDSNNRIEDIRVYHGMENILAPAFHSFSRGGSSVFDNVNKIVTITDNNGSITTYPVPKGWEVLGTLNGGDLILRKGLAVISMLDYYGETI